MSVKPSPQQDTEEATDLRHLDGRAQCRYLLLYARIHLFNLEFLLACLLAHAALLEVEVEADEAPQLLKPKEEPEVDADGFITVKGKGKGHR